MTSDTTLLLDTEWFELADLTNAIDDLLAGNASESQAEALFEVLPERVPLLLAEGLVDLVTLGRCVAACAERLDVDRMVERFEELDAYEVIADLARNEVPFRVSPSMAVRMAEDRSISDPPQPESWSDPDDQVAWRMAYASRGPQERAEIREYDIDLANWDSPRYQGLGKGLV